MRYEDAINYAMKKLYRGNLSDELREFYELALKEIMFARDYENAKLKGCSCMTRLIDVDKLIDALGVRNCYKYKNPKAYDTLMLYEILGAIEDQPTAYDVDKVVGEIEAFGGCTECREKGTDKRFYYGQGCKACVFGKIVAIVKRGGADDK